MKAYKGFNADMTCRGFQYKEGETYHEGYHANPLYIENKSKRLQLLTKPSTAEKLRAKAQREGRSVNDIVNTILEEALREDIADLCHKGCHLCPRGW